MGRVGLPVPYFNTLTTIFKDSILNISTKNDFWSSERWSIFKREMHEQAIP